MDSSEYYDEKTKTMNLSGVIPKNTGEFKLRIKRSRRRELENQIELFNSDKLNVRERKRWQNYHYRIRKDSELSNKLNMLEHMLDDELIKEISNELPEDITTLFISSIAQKGIVELKDLIWKKLNL